MSARRRADSVYLQYIWNALEVSSGSAAGLSFQAILSAIQSNCDPKCTATRLHHELGNAMRDGCVRSEKGLYALVDGFEQSGKDGHDWYCYECHTPGLVVSCATCFRVYHPECLAAACEAHWSCRLPAEDPTVGSKEKPELELPPFYPCPVCKRLKRVSLDNTTSVGDLRKIFSKAHDGVRNRVNWKTMQKVGYLQEPLRNEYLVYRQINTRMIGDRLRSDPSSPGGYPNRTAFLIDLDNLVHNAAVFYGKEHMISNMARQIRSLLRREMRESVYCVDCYIRASTMSAKDHLTSPCRKPHRLFWFQHNGWSFRPCKVLYESSEGYEVVCFGGRHEREFVPPLRAVDMTFSALDLGLRMTPALKKALDEAEEYKANQSAFDRSLPIPSAASYTTKSAQSSTHSKSEQSSVTSDFPLTARKTPCSSEKVLVSNRKRKAISKSSSVFGSTDNESVSSLTSACAKRLKSIPNCVTRENVVHRTTNTLGKCRTGRLSYKFTQEYIDDSSMSSTFDSDTDYSDSENHGSSPPKICDKQSNDCTRLSAVSRLDATHSSTPATKPRIRIKPILPPKEHQTSSPQTSQSPKSSHVTAEHVGFRSKAKPSTSCSSPSSYSALSGPSSGATIPATASREDATSGDSSSTSSSPSKKCTILKRLRCPPIHQKPHTRRKNSVIDTESVTRSPKRGSFPPTSVAQKALDNPPMPDLGPRLPYPSRSLSSSSSSACDSDSDDSPCTLSTSSTSSRDSSIISSDSTILSPSRRSSFSVKHNEVTKISALTHTKRPVDIKPKSVDYVALKTDTKLTNAGVDRGSGSSSESQLDRQIQRSSSKQSSLTRSAVSPFLNTTCVQYCEPEGTLKPSKIKKAMHQTAANSTDAVKLSHGLTTKNNSAPKTTGSVSATRFQTSCGSHTPVTVISTTGSISVGPTPPFASSSSWHFSVSPAAMSTTSGLGSSLSDPKSVDASPGEGVTVLGSNNSFGCGHPGVAQTVTADPVPFKSVEEQVHRMYAERLASLTTERDQIREEVVRRDALISKLRVEHETEIKRIKQMTWCQVCLNEAFYHCCPGTAYCSESCQLQHWTQQHNRDCRRRGEAQQLAQQ